MMRNRHYFILLIGVISTAVLAAACNGQSVSKKPVKSDWKLYGLKGKVKRLKEEYRPAQYDAIEDTIYMSLATLDPDPGTGRAFTMKFNNKGFKTKYSYEDIKPMQEHYIYANDTLLIEYRKYSSIYVDVGPAMSRPDTLRVLTQRYNQQGNVVYLAYYDPNDLIMTKPNDVYTFEYDQHGNCEDIHAKFIFYKNDRETVEVIDEVDFGFKNTYNDHNLLLSQQFTAGDGSILEYDANGEIADSNEGKYLEGKGPDNTDYLAGDKQVFEYDSRGNKTKVTQISARKLQSHNTYTYHNNNELATAKYYDINGRLFAEEKYNELGQRVYLKLSSGVYTYTYIEPDEYGNWIRCEIRKTGGGYTQDRVYFYIKREIEYYD